MVLYNLISYEKKGKREEERAKWEMGKPPITSLQKLLTTKIQIHLVGFFIYILFFEIDRERKRDGQKVGGCLMLCMYLY